MNRQQLLDSHDDLCRKAKAIMVAKNHDYASAGDPFENFRLCEQMQICSTEAGVLIRLMDKMRRLSGFMKNGVLQVKDESIEDTILDAINYLVIVRAVISSRTPAASADASAAAGETAARPSSDAPTPDGCPSTIELPPSLDPLQRLLVQQQACLRYQRAGHMCARCWSRMWNGTPGDTP